MGVSKPNIALIIYAIVILPMELMDNVLFTILLCIAHMLSIIGCAFLFKYYSNIPRHKQSILIFLTKWLTFTMVLYLVRMLVGNMIVVFLNEPLESIFKQNPILMCNLWDFTILYQPFCMIMIEIMVMKIILILSPVRFLRLNTSKVKIVCLLMPIAVIIQNVVLLLAQRNCRFQTLKIVFKTAFKSEIALTEEEEGMLNQTFPYSRPLMCCIFLLEITSRIVAYLLKWEIISQEGESSKDNLPRIRQRPLEEGTLQKIIEEISVSRLQSKSTRSTSINEFQKSKRQYRYGDRRVVSLNDLSQISTLDNMCDSNFEFDNPKIITTEQNPNQKKSTENDNTNPNRPIKKNYNSYGAVIFMVFFQFLTLILFLIVLKIENEIAVMILSKLLVVIYRLQWLVLPIGWIINHKPILDFVKLKFRQFVICIKGR